MDKVFRVLGNVVYWTVILIIMGVVTFHMMGPGGIALIFILGVMYATYLALRLVFRTLRFALPSVPAQRFNGNRDTADVEPLMSRGFSRSLLDDDFGQSASETDSGIFGSRLYTDPEYSWFPANVFHQDRFESSSFSHDHFGSNIFSHDTFGGSDFDNGIGDGSNFDSGLDGSGMSGGFGGSFGDQ